MRKIKVYAGLLALLFAAMVGVLYSKMRLDQPQMFDTARVDDWSSEETAAIPNFEPKNFNLLVFSKTNGYRHHVAISAAKHWLHELASARNWGVLDTENAAIFDSKQLALFDVVIFNNATRPALTQSQKSNFEQFIELGKGFVGIHSAGDGSHTDWPWYTANIICTEFIGHTVIPHIQQATIRLNRAAKHPATNKLPGTWQHEEEWYSFTRAPDCPAITVLARVDEETYSPGYHITGKSLSMGADHPVIWAGSVGKGRTYYTALGHQGETFSDPLFQSSIEQAILWTGRKL